MTNILKLTLGKVPLYLIIPIALIVFFAAKHHDLSNDMIGGLAAMMVSGYMLREIGERTPILNRIGGSAIMCIFVPSMLVGHHLVQLPTLIAITTTMKTSNLMYLFLSCIIVGSILGVDRKLLIHGFGRIVIPLIVGTIVASACGVGMGVLLGRPIGETFFFIVTPILSGGVAEGVLPLSIAYSEILGLPDTDILAKLFPAALIANLFAILSAGLLAQLAQRYPSLTGNGNLIKGLDQSQFESVHSEPIDYQLMGAGLLIICAFFTLGRLLSPMVGMPGVVVMILSVVVFKFLGVLPREIDRGAYAMYQFMSKNLTPAVLVGVGMIYVPWDKLVESFTLDFVLICCSTVIGMVLSTFFTARAVGAYPIECAVVCATHSGLGGSGDIAILTAANRLNLMPFASMATRLGGVLMIVFSTYMMRLH
jgi:malate:Na+ symporter